MKQELQEWRLGGEPGKAREAGADTARPGPAPDLSRERLSRPLYVLTPEMLGWLLVSGYALLSRLLMLGGRPLSPADARAALLDLEIARSGLGALGHSPLPHSAWVNLIGAAGFLASGDDQFPARLAPVLGGLLMVGAALAMRPWLGRAGSLAMAAMLTLSPSATYFSRSGTAVVPALAMALVALALIVRMSRRWKLWRALAVGCTGGLGLAADPSGLITGASMVAAAVVLGLVRLVAGRHRWLEVRLWWEHRGALAVLSAATVLAIWLFCASDFAAEPVIGATAAGIAVALRGATSPSHLAGLDFYLPVLTLYEFVIVVGALVGLLAFVGVRLRSWFAVWSVSWMVFALAFCLWMPPRTTDWTLVMLVPMGLVGALGIDHIHHTRAWRVLRIPAAALLLFGLYVQVLTNFVYVAPDAGEAPFARHATLFWTEATTTLQTPRECARVLRAVPAVNRTVFFKSDSPTLRWYLRSLGEVGAADSAAVTVQPGPPAPASPGQSVVARRFDLEDRWSPALGALTPQGALHYVLTARAFAPLEKREVTVVVRRPFRPAPTVIFGAGP